MPATADPATTTRSRGRPYRASTYFWLVVVAACVVGALYLWKGVGTRFIYAAARDLPAYHQITERDVRRVPVRSSESPEKSTVDREALLDRYTLGPVAQDKPFDTSKVGPVLSPRRLARARIVGLGASHADVIGGRLARGDRVNLLFPNRAGGDRRPVQLERLLMLDVRKRPGSAAHYVVVLAVSGTDEEIFMAAAVRDGAFFTRAAPYRRP
jgi:hypothetical protein